VTAIFSSWESWLITGDVLKKGEKEPKRGKSKESDDFGTKKMLVQLEARMRAKEKYTMTQVPLPADHPRVVWCQAQYQSYLVQVKKDQRSRGPPELNMCARAPNDIESCLAEAPSR
jgi:hypothetical protein